MIIQYSRLSHNGYMNETSSSVFTRAQATPLAPIKWWDLLLIDMRVRSTHLRKNIANNRIYMTM